MKVREIKVKAFSAANMAALETAVNTYLAAAGERTFLGLQYQVYNTDYTALLTYLE